MTASASKEFTADDWLVWLHRTDDQPLPSRFGLNDCAAALAAEIERLRALLAEKG